MEPAYTQRDWYFQLFANDQSRMEKEPTDKNKDLKEFLSKSKFSVENKRHYS